MEEGAKLKAPADGVAALHSEANRHDKLLAAKDPYSQAPSDAQRATVDVVNVSLESLRTIADEIPDYDYPSSNGAALPQEYCQETKQAEPAPGASPHVENVFAAAATTQIHTASCQGVKPTASETAHEEHGFHAPNSRPMTRLRRASLKADHVAVAPSKKRKFDHVLVAIPTQRSARLGNALVLEEGANLKAPADGVAALHPEANRNDKLFVANDDIIMSSRTAI